MENNEKRIIQFNEANTLKLIQALESGSPLDIALRYSRISPYIFAYYQKIGIVHHCIVEEGLTHAPSEYADIIDKITNSTIYNSINNVFTYPIIAETIAKRNQMFNYIANMYKTNRFFRQEAIKIYEYMLDCDEAIVKNVIYHTQNIRLATDKKNGRDSRPSEWYLEHAVPQFAKNNNVTNTINLIADNNSNNNIRQVEIANEPIRIQFVDPAETISQTRLIEMENKAIEKIEGKTNA